MNDKFVNSKIDNLENISACGENQVKCDNGLCVNENLKCDGNNDCGDWSDEESNCSTLSFVSDFDNTRFCFYTLQCLCMSIYWAFI